MATKPLLIALALSLACSAQALEPELQLVGEARLKFLFWSVYDSRLFSTDGNYRDGQRPVRLEIEYQLDIGSEDLVERTASEWESQGVHHRHQGRWLELLSGLWPDVRKGDFITLELDRANRSTFYHNGKLLGAVEDADFGQYFIDIWLSPNTSYPELRLALLGQRHGRPSL